MRGLDPRIHHLRMNLSKKMDCRVKPGNDESSGTWLRLPRLPRRQRGGYCGADIGH
jgi:hypothetical protein